MKQIFCWCILMTAGLPAYDVKAKGSLDFVQNKKQWPEQVQYRAGLPGGAVFFTADRFVYSYYSHDDMRRIHELMEEKKDLQHEQLRGHAYQVIFAGSNTAAVSGNDKRAWHHNYYQGSDPAKWSTGVPVYEGVTYDELYTGIDLAVYSMDASMKYDFIVAPGADPAVIRLQFDGVTPKLTKEGAIELRTSVNTVIEQAPYVYQEVNGHKQEVKCRYVLNRNGEIGFAFPEGYDRSRELIIDPTLIYATWSGATVNANASSVACDDAGQLYAFSAPFQVGWPVTMGAFQSTPAGAVDLGINKYNATGSSLIYSTYVGGSAGDVSLNTIVNNNEELIVFGITSSTDFPTTPGCYRSTLQGFDDFFVLHFNTAGTALLGSTYMGGSDASDGGDRGGIALDAAGNIICGSSTGCTDMPVTAGVYQPATGGSYDGCLFKFDPTCSSLLFSTYLGGSSSEAINDLRTDGNGNIVLCGLTISADFPTTAGVVNPVALGGTDGMACVLSPDATSLLHATYLGTADNETAQELALDPDENIYVGGFSDGTTYPVSAGVYSNAGGSVFIHKMNSSLGHLASTTLGDPQGPTMVGDRPVALHVDGCGSLVYGFFYLGSALAVTPNALQTTPGSMYIGQLTPNMSALAFGTYLGDSSDPAHSHGQPVVFDPQGMMYANVCTIAFATTPGVWQPTTLAGGLYEPLSFKLELGLPYTKAQFQIDGNDTGCVPFTVQFTNNSINATSYQWNFGDGNTSTSAAPSHTYTAPGTYYAKLTAFNPAACNEEDTMTIIIYVLPGDTATVSVDSFFCHPDPMVLQAPAGYANHTWQDGSTNAAFSINDGGTFFVVSANTCARRIDTFHIEEIELPFSLGPDTVVCAPYLLEGPEVNDLTYLWNNGNTAPDITVNATGQYWLKVSKKGCSYADTVSVRYDVNRTRSSDTLLCNDQLLDIRLETTIPAGATALWSTGSTGPQIQVQTPGTYWVTVTKGSCFVSDTTHVRHEYCDCELLVPSAFSPNNDGRNDLFRVLLPEACKLTGFTLSVYNRWGQRVFSTVDPTKGWNGIFNEKPCDPGTYMYVVDGYAGTKGVHRQQKGDVQLVR